MPGSENAGRLAGYVLQPGEGRVIPVPFGRASVTMKAESHQTGGAITVYEALQEPHSVGPARHYHKRLTEVFSVTEGTITFLVGTALHQAPAGAVVVIPPGTVHAFRNAESAPARMLIMVLPGGFEGFFDEARDLHVPMSDGEAWRAINERWDTHVVGPPIER
jgi:quercetin dioxygenase-like cupin family protein